MKLLNIIHDYILQESINDKNIFKAIILCGGPGSGKSFISNNLLGNKFFGAILIGSDEFFEFLLKKNNLSLKIDINNPNQMVHRSKAISMTNSKLYQALNSMLPIYIDGTGQDYKKIQKQYNSLIEIGYDVSIVFVNTTLEVALERNRLRRRSLPDSLVEEAWNNVQNNLNFFNSLVGSSNFYIIENSNSFEPNSKEETDFLNYLFKKGQSILNKPLKNQNGKDIIEYMKDNNLKYLSDVKDEELIKQVNVNKVK